MSPYVRFDLTHAGQVGTDDPKDADDIMHLVLRKFRRRCEITIISIGGQSDPIVAPPGRCAIQQTGHDHYLRFEIRNRKQ